MTGRELLRRAAKVLAPVQPRRAAVALGARLSLRSITRVAQVLGALEQGHWLAGEPLPIPNLSDRFALFDFAIARVHGDEPVYLEFGVYRGRSMRHWATALRQPRARLVGFDSFEGLPEDWQHETAQGAFYVGEPPAIDDPRVTFVVGRFERTLEHWAPPPHDQLVANVDCDLYSSTKVVLDWLSPHLRPGDLVYFDDLLGRDHEWRALREWREGAGRDAVPVAMARWGQHMLFEMGPVRRDRAAGGAAPHDQDDGRGPAADRPAG